MGDRLATLHTHLLAHWPSFPCEQIHWSRESAPIYQDLYISHPDMSATIPRISRPTLYVSTQWPYFLSTTHKHIPIFPPLFTNASRTYTYSRAPATLILSLHLFCHIYSLLLTVAWICVLDNGKILIFLLYIRNNVTPIQRAGREMSHQHYVSSIRGFKHHELFRLYTFLHHRGKAPLRFELLIVLQFSWI